MPANRPDGDVLAGLPSRDGGVPGNRPDGDAWAGLHYGILVGLGYEMVHSSLKKLKSLFQEHLVRELASGYLDEPPIKDASLKTFFVEVRPAYFDRDKSFPANHLVHIPVSAVFGKTPYESFECFLPFMRNRFDFYSPDQLENLVSHYARDFLTRLSPEEMFRHSFPENPWLEEVSIQVEEDKNRPPKRYFIGKLFLEKIAEKYPCQKGFDRRIRGIPVSGGEQETFVKKVVELLRMEKSHVILVGESGVGKTEILKRAINSHFQKEKPAEKPGISFWRTSPSLMRSGAKYLGDWQENCEKIITDLISVQGILWVDGFPGIFQEGGEGIEDSMAAYFFPFMVEGKVRMVAEMTPGEFDRAAALFPGFIGLFQIIHIPEMDSAKVVSVFENFKESVRKNLGIGIQSNALDTAHRLLKRYIKNESFPGKAVKFLSGCVQEAANNERKEVSESDIVEGFARKTGMPEFLLRDDLPLNENEMKSFFTGGIIGQENSLEVVYDVIRVFKAGLNDPNKPIATMVFAGPTGVGKTATSILLAKFLFGAGSEFDPLIRLDMSEFQYPFQINRIIGDRGNNPGKLIGEVRRRPFSVILLDEIEKAHESIFDALMTLFDEGILTDSLGRRTDFRNSIIIMTTNLGSQTRDSIGFSKEGERDFLGSMKSFFRPEFYNRIDFFLTFNPLSSKVIRQITLKELHEIVRREGLMKRKISLEFSDSLVKHLSKVGFDRRFGARPLQRAIEREVVAPLAKFLLLHRNLKNQKLNLGFSDKNLSIQP